MTRPAGGTTPRLHIRVDDECNSSPDEFEESLRVFMYEHDVSEEDVQAIYAGDCIALDGGRRFPGATLRVQLASVANGRRF